MAERHPLTMKPVAKHPTVTRLNKDRFTMSSQLNSGREFMMLVLPGLVRQ